MARLGPQMIDVKGSPEGNPYAATVRLVADKESLAGLVRVVPPFFGGEHILKGIAGNWGSIKLQHVVSNSEATILSVGHTDSFTIATDFSDNATFTEAVQHIGLCVEELVTVLGTMASPELFESTADHLDGILLCDDDFEKFKQR